MKTLQSFSARTSEPFGASQPVTTPDQLDSAVHAAADAFVSWSASTGSARAALLRGLALALEVDREALLLLADEETTLGLPRLNGELDRTAFHWYPSGQVWASV